MTEKVEFPLANCELRSFVGEDARLYLSLEVVEIGSPVGDELVVRVEGAPMNPSDLGSMLGGVSADAFRLTDNGGLVADIPEADFGRLSARVGQSIGVGLEGMGTVVAAGELAQHLVGNVVAMVGGGMYTQYRKINAGDCLALPNGTSPEDGAGAFVNPMTSLSLVETMRRDGHTALVHTAAASNLGQMLVKICKSDGVGLVNVVRSEAQVTLLKGLGAKYVCNSSSPTFDDELVAAIGETGATIAFDAVGGGDLASRILAAMERANTGKTPYSRYGSNVYKQVYFYGGLDTSPIVLRKNYGMAWGAGGWLLFPFLEKIGNEATAALKARVEREIYTTFASEFGHSATIREILCPEKIRVAAARSTGSKFLIKPNL